MSPALVKSSIVLIPGRKDNFLRLSLLSLDGRWWGYPIKQFFSIQNCFNLKIIWSILFFIGYATRRDDYNPSFLHLNDEYFHALPSDLRCIFWFEIILTHFLLPFVSFLTLYLLLQSMMQNTHITDFLWLYNQISPSFGWGCSTSNYFLLPSTVFRIYWFEIARGI